MSEDEKTIDNKIYRILIVDDEQNILDSLLSLLERNEYFKSKVVTVNSAEAGLKELEKKEFDLVLSDYKMPGMNGVEFLGKVRGKYPKTILVCLSPVTLMPR